MIELIYRAISFLCIVLLLAACENDIEKINLLNTSGEYPNIAGEDIEMIYSDSARVKVQMFAKSLKQFNNVEKPYSEFPEGLKVYVFDAQLEIESVIQANY